MTQIDDPWHMLSEEERMFCEVLERICAGTRSPRSRPRPTRPRASCMRNSPFSARPA